MTELASQSCLCAFNGVNGATGRYLTQPTTLEAWFAAAFGDYGDTNQPAERAALARMISGSSVGPAHLEELLRRHSSAQPHLGPRPGIDTRKLEQTGWGIIFAQNVEPAIKDALHELLEWRKAQAGEYYHEFEWDRECDHAGAHLAFLARHGMGPGQADPRHVPYYLLITGDPEAIPFAFQCQLDVQYAVGRLWFDTADEYAHYAHSVVTAEKGQIALARRAVVFGARNADDHATRQSAELLVEPLGQLLSTPLGKGQPAWNMQTVLASDATKHRLAQLLGGDETPALLFTASHGMGFPNGDPRQRPDTGALLCQDWPGPKDWGAGRPIPLEHYFAAVDVASDAKLHGIIAMHFACYSAGCPRLDDFSHLVSSEPQEIAPRPFLAKLPNKLLSHPRGGALAVIGHVDRTWGYSFHWHNSGTQLQVFEDTLKELMRGQPVGAALEPFNQRYADLSSALSSALQDVRYGKRPDVEGLAGMWTANNDARSYVIIGDPAVRLPLAPHAAVTYERPAVAMITHSPAPTGAHQGSGTPAPPRPAGAAGRSLVPQRRGVAGEAPARHDPTDLVSGTGLGYYLLAFDEQGRERVDHPRGCVSRLISDALELDPITDVFLFSHGWQGDIPEARRQYRDWVGAMAERHSDRARIAQLRPNFWALLIGIHWPSRPWGDEEIGAASFAPKAGAPVSSVEKYARRLGDTPEIRQQLHTIVSAAKAPRTPDRLPRDVSEAYHKINKALELGSLGIAGPPGADHEPFDPEAVYSAALLVPELNENIAFGTGGVNEAVLAPLRTLSFWKMKDRACLVGERSVHPLLAGWQHATADRDVRFHLVGHSFGCIVATAAVAGRPGSPALPRPVDSLSLLQGALSLWSYCGDIPHARGKEGYFHRVVSDGRVQGPIIATLSRHDRAVGIWYPLATRIAGQVGFAVGLPKYGGVGTFGIQGQDLFPAHMAMGSETASYEFQARRPHNLDASRYICQGGGFSGAHSDICRPEVAHATWSAAT
jgi:hypothetical protein